MNQVRGKLLFSIVIIATLMLGCKTDDPSDPDFSPHYSIELTLNENMTDYSGSMALRFQNKNTEPLDTLQFVLYPNLYGGLLEVSGINVSGVKVDPVLEDGESILLLPLATPLTQGDSIETRMDFRGRAPLISSQGSPYLVSDGETLLLSLFHPYLNNSGRPFASPPSYGDPDVFAPASYELRLSHPTAMTSAASGIEVSSRRQGERLHSEYTLHAARDLAVAASLNWEKHSLVSTEDVAVHSYFPKDFSQRGELAVDFASFALDQFSRQMARYPYTELDIVAVPSQVLGVEFPGLIAINQNLYDSIGRGNRRAPQSLFESVVVHEVAHQWFYNLLGSNQVLEPWIDEGFAQYLTYLYFRERYGQSGAAGVRDSFEQRLKRISQIDAPVGGPVIGYTPAEYSALIYGRAPLFLIQLEEELGSEAFADFLRSLSQKHLWAQLNTEILHSELEAFFDRDFDEEFESWVYRVQTQ